MTPQPSNPPTPTYDTLRALMARYTTAHLRPGLSPDDFRRRIDAFLGLSDADMEGYHDPGRQRDLSVRFHWGHDHDFGAFALKGRMGDRHLRLIATYVDSGALPIDLTGARVFDIGSWTGGTSLLLAAMGATVYAIEEVRKYVDCANFLAYAFGVDDRVTTEPRSLYACTTPDLQDRFDFVHYSGVLYHVSDPVLSLRICFNTLKDGGACLVETQGITDPAGRPMVHYDGPRVTHSGSAEERSRGGWNWFVPSPAAVANMLDDVGFTDVRATGIIDQRVFATARRTRHVDMLRAGLSVPDIR